MSARELIVLGTSSQVPTRHRNHNGYLLRWDGKGLLFDPGEGIQRQMTYFGLSVHAIHHILITHFHGDHCLGLAGLCQRISLDEVRHEVGLHYHQSGQKYIDRLRKASIFVDRAHIANRPFEAEGPIEKTPMGTLETVALDHGVPSFGYRLVEPDGWRVDPTRVAALGLPGPSVGKILREGHADHEGQRVLPDAIASRRPGQRFALVMDTRLCDGAFRLAEGADLLVCESTYLESESQEANRHGHLTARQAARIAVEAGARRLVLTHFSRRYPSMDRFVQEASELHGDVVAVRDGDHVDVPARQC